MTRRREVWKLLLGFVYFMYSSCKLIKLTKFSCQMQIHRKTRKKNKIIYQEILNKDKQMSFTKQVKLIRELYRRHTQK